MGVFYRYSGSSVSFGPKNPDPYRYEILETYQYDKAFVLVVQYPGCTISWLYKL